MTWKSVTLAVALIAMSVPAWAQTAGPVPNRGMTAVGLSVGAAMPGGDALNNGWALTGSVERYLTQRVAVRGQVSAAWWGIGDFGDNYGVSPVAALGSLVYNWERGAWHPYGVVGLGVYKFRFTEDDIDSHDTAVGFNIGGGADYFLTRRDAVTAELLIHPLVGGVDSRNGTYLPWYWSLSAGYKKFF